MDLRKAKNEGSRAWPQTPVVPREFPGRTRGRSLIHYPDVGGLDGTQGLRSPRQSAGAAGDAEGRRCARGRWGPGESPGGRGACADSGVRTSEGRARTSRGAGAGKKGLSGAREGGKADPNTPGAQRGQPRRALVVIAVLRSSQGPWRGRRPVKAWSTRRGDLWLLPLIPTRTTPRPRRAPLGPYSLAINQPHSLARPPRRPGFLSCFSPAA